MQKFVQQKNLTCIYNEKKDKPCNHKDFQFKASQAKNHK